MYLANLTIREEVPVVLHPKTKTLIKWAVIDILLLILFFKALPMIIWYCTPVVKEETTTVQFNN